MARRSAKTIVIDRGRDRVVREMKALGDVGIDVGLFADSEKHEGSRFTLPEIGAVNEFGSADGQVPARPFLRTSFDERSKEYQDLAKQLIGRMIDGRLTPLQVLNQLGLKMVGDVKQKITDIRTPPNAISTVEQKGFDNPLIHTGLMRAQIKHRVKL